MVARAAPSGRATPFLPAHRLVVGLSRSLPDTELNRVMSRIEPHYHPIQQAVHWFAALCIVLAWISAQFLVQDSGPILQIHILAGMLVLYVLPLRYLWRLLRPVEIGPGRAWERRWARIVHALLYLTMLALPVTGIVAAEAGGQAVHFGAAMTLPQIGEPDAFLRALAMRGHRLLSDATVALVGLHVLAVLKHAVVDRDRTLLRMLAGPQAQDRRE
jgi:cytochrome b561